MIELPEKVYKLLSKKYNIIDVISFLEFDFDFNQLRLRLAALRKDQFDVNDRIIIEHLDTDFYIKHCSVGINLLNFFNTVADVDVPKFIFLFYTNHFGIAQEIDTICNNVNDRPTIIESFVSDLHHNPHGYPNHHWPIEDITHQSLCMINLKRSHRNAMYHQVKNISSGRLALSATTTPNAT